MLKKTQKVSCNFRVEDLCYLNKSTEVQLDRNVIYNLHIDYPLSKPLIHNIKVGGEGLGLHGLLREIGKAYKNAYNQDKKYGIWGHDMHDLQLEGIEINHKEKVIKIFVGS